MNRTPVVHAIVLGYGQFQKTSQICLDSLIPQAEALNIPVLIFDNGSPDDSLFLQEKYLETHPNVKSLSSPINLGFAGGMNEAAQNIDTQWLLLVGSDTIFTKNSLNCLYKAIQNAPENVGLVGPVSNNSGNAQKISFKSNKFSEINKIIDSKWSEPSNLMCPIYRVDFFCVAIRKNLWVQLNGLDLSYGRGYYEDFDFCMRAKKLNYQCLMIEDAFVFHTGSASFKKVQEQKYLIQKNKKFFLLKHPNAKLSHLRQDNFLTLKYYLKILESSHKNGGMVRVINSRINSLQQELPKSFLKKIWWQIKIYFLKNQFLKIGIKILT
jgi:GT2 family glycosyltransferase